MVPWLYEVPLIVEFFDGIDDDDDYGEDVDDNYYLC